MKATGVAGALLLHNLAAAKADGSNDQEVKDLQETLQQFVRNREADEETSLEEAGIAVHVQNLFGNDTAALMIWNDLSKH